MSIRAHLKMRTRELRKRRSAVTCWWRGGLFIQVAARKRRDAQAPSYEKATGPDGLVLASPMQIMRCGKLKLSREAK